MNCEVVYAIVPKEKTFSELIQQQARKYIEQNFEEVNHSMMLERQQMSVEERKKIVELRVAEIVREIDPIIWNC